MVMEANVAPGAGQGQAGNKMPEPTLADTQALADKHKRKPGRPPGSKTKSKTIQPTLPGSGVPDPLLQQNLALVKKGVHSILTAVDGLVCRHVFGRAVKLGAEEALAKEYAVAVGLTKPEAEIICESSATIFVRHEFLMRYAPEILLASVLASYGMRAVTVIKKLDSLEVKLRAKQKAESGSLTQEQ